MNALLVVVALLDPVQECRDALEVFCGKVLPLAPAEPEPAWMWALAGGGAVLAAVGSCELAGCSPGERAAAATAALAGIVGGALVF